MSDPTQPPAAIVQPAGETASTFSDPLYALMDQARAFGRKTVEAKLAAGQKLIEVQEKWLERNGPTTTRDGREKWSKFLKRFGFSEQTARRLITAARFRESVAKLATEFDGIYDDGYDPALDAGKKPCRDCRMKGREYSDKCSGCREFNREPTEPEDAKPPVDMDGTPIPAHLVPAFQESKLIREWNRTVLREAAKGLTGLAERSGCAAIDTKELTKRLQALCTFAWKYRFGRVCPDCGGQKCPKCGNNGFLPAKVVDEERAIERLKKKAQKAKEWHEKKARSNRPIPE